MALTKEDFNVEQYIIDFFDEHDIEDRYVAHYTEQVTDGAITVDVDDPTSVTISDDGTKIICASEEAADALFAKLYASKVHMIDMEDDTITLDQYDDSMNIATSTDGESITFYSIGFDEAIEAAAAFDEEVRQMYADMAYDAYVERQMERQFFGE